MIIYSKWWGSYTWRLHREHSFPGPGPTSVRWAVPFQGSSVSGSSTPSMRMFSWTFSPIVKLCRLLGSSQAPWWEPVSSKANSDIPRPTEHTSGKITLYLRGGYLSNSLLLGPCGKRHSINLGRCRISSIVTSICRLALLAVPLPLSLSLPPSLAFRLKDVSVGVPPRGDWIRTAECNRNTKCMIISFDRLTNHNK